MRKILISILILTLCLSGCRSATQEVPASENQQQSDFSTAIPETNHAESDAAVTVTDANSLKYSFRSYSITIPDSWGGLYTYEQSDDSIAFYEKQNYERNGSGFLFSLSLYPQNSDYEYLPSCKLVGDINENGTNNSENLVAMFPTDVQCDADTISLYQEMQDDIDAILNSVVEAPGYTFCPNEENS